MPEREPNFEEMLEALKDAVSKIDQESEAEMPGQDAFKLARETLSLMPERPPHLLNDFMRQQQELKQLWMLAETEEKKLEVKNRIQKGLERIIETLQRRPKS